MLIHGNNFTPKVLAHTAQQLRPMPPISFCMPRNAAQVLIVDPATDTADISTIVGLSGSADKWRGGVLAGNGKIYGMPSPRVCISTAIFPLFTLPNRCCRASLLPCCAVFIPFNFYYIYM